ncbi:hypothetical protein CORC01_07537 [Colletotrichum orchidophilum]|uniref:MYND-type domain-containing protein n=1 Tax=Colletotrichum orchidophilum TaxID=1209926 RepID=A0A1G4B6Y7_9PEZI|nr:uncharacterized protein CORC01_07537 [Colletotrichum orchidophilum]OHE97096.1 hypothetical protein CORC01_07537 [Colletotrichum orchidophilum]
MMERAVREFKALRRPKTTPTGLDNNWVFGVRHVDLNPPGDLVLAVHPISSYLLQAGPAQILSQPTARDRAKAVVPLLLQAFSNGRPGTDLPTFAPWSWSTDSPELAATIGPELAAAGIAGGLQKVTVCSAADKAILDEAWSDVKDLLTRMTRGEGAPDAQTSGSANRTPAAVSPGDASRCHGCGLSSDRFTEPMKKCSACLKAWYHSQDCQRAHWKQHKPTCLANRPAAQAAPAPAPSTTTRPGMDPSFNYYNNVARKSPDGQSLLRSLHVDPITTNGGLELPLRRLIVAGKDTPENMRILFGPTFLSDMKGDQARLRIEVLLDPPRGSPMYAQQAYDDAGSEALVRSVRPPSQAEEKTLREVREIQEKVKQKVGVGRSPDSGVMKDVLTSFGPNWPQKMQLYMLAVNTMDQGVHR